jgi:hypothetical protein
MNDWADNRDVIPIAVSGITVRVLAFAATVAAFRVPGPLGVYLVILTQVVLYAWTSLILVGQEYQKQTDRVTAVRFRCMKQALHLFWMDYRNNAPHVDFRWQDADDQTAKDIKMEREIATLDRSWWGSLGLTIWTALVPIVGLSARLVVAYLVAKSF